MNGSAEGLLGRIAALRPMLEANASRTEADRRVVEENITALREAGAFKTTVPQRYGGYQSTIRTKLEVSREIAMGCGSTSWTTTLMNVCAFFVSLMNEQAQNDVWGSNPDARIAGVFTPSATSRKVDGGIVVTGSNTIHANEVFVPDHRTHWVPGLLTHQYDTPFTDEVYRSEFVPVAALVLAGPQLGLAQAALDYVIEILRPRRRMLWVVHHAPRPPLLGVPKHRDRHLPRPHRRSHRRYGVLGAPPRDLIPASPTTAAAEHGSAAGCSRSLRSRAG